MHQEGQGMADRHAQLIKEEMRPAPSYTHPNSEPCGGFAISLHSLSASLCRIKNIMRYSGPFFELVIRGLSLEHENPSESTRESQYRTNSARASCFDINRGSILLRQFGANNSKRDWSRSKSSSNSRCKSITLKCTRMSMFLNLARRSITENGSCSMLYGSR